MGVTYQNNVTSIEVRLRLLEIGNEREIMSRSTEFLTRSGPEVIKFFSCSTQLSMKIFQLINLKLQTAAKSFLLNIAEHENFSANKCEKQRKFHAPPS